MKLSGQAGVVTGSGSGIGRAIARLLAAEGASVIVADLDRVLVDETVAEINALGGNARGCPADVTSERDVEAAVQLCVERFGRLDIMCNNAGISEGLLLADEISPETWSRVIAVNLTGVFLGCHFALPVMIGQERGVILNTASVAGVVATRAGAAYTASKWGVVGLTKNIANSHGEDGIRCNAICPGPVKTAIGAQASKNISPRAERVANRSLLTRPSGPIEAEEVARLALYLVSDDSAHINGSTVVINGGRGVG
jgi:NAD(P)-dependent dehydrogenase (short-subunit alcohol dehydrogenase family)